MPGKNLNVNQRTDVKTVKTDQGGPAQQVDTDSLATPVKPVELADVAPVSVEKTTAQQAQVTEREPAKPAAVNPREALKTLPDVVPTTKQAAAPKPEPAAQVDKPSIGGGPRVPEQAPKSEAAPAPAPDTLAGSPLETMAAAAVEQIASAPEPASPLDQRPVESDPVKRPEVAISEEDAARYVAEHRIVEDPTDAVMTPVMPPSKIDSKKAKANRYSTTRFAPVLAETVDQAKESGPTVGQTVMDELIPDEHVSFMDVSIPYDMVWKAYSLPGSVWRDLFSSDPEFDEQSWLTDRAWGIRFAMAFAEQWTVPGLAEKMPVVGEAGAHARRVHIHDGPGIRIHPLTFAIWNADHDGDEMKVSVDRDAWKAVKNALSFLISPTAVNLIDSSFFGWVPWVDTDGMSVREVLEILFDYELESSELDEMTELLPKCWSNDGAVADEGFRDLIRLAVAIGDRVDGTDPATRQQFSHAQEVTGHIINQLWLTTRDMRWEMQVFNGYLDYIDGPKTIEDDLGELVAGEIVEAPFPKLASKAKPEASMTGLARLAQWSIGFITKRNPHFRQPASLGKMAREVKHFLGRRSADARSMLEDTAAFMMSGSEEYDEHAFAFTEAARKRIRDVMLRGWDESKGPIVPQTDEGFRTWMDKFIRMHNLQAFAINNVAALVNLDKSLSPEDAKNNNSMPYIEEDSDLRYQNARSEFKKIFGEYTMSQLFGNRAPAGAEDVPLAVWIENQKIDPRDLLTQESQVNTSSAFILRLADLRTSFARDYNRLLEETLAALITTSRDGETGTFARFIAINRNRKLQRNIDDASLDADLYSVVEAFVLLGPEFFERLRLDTVERFFTTELGRRYILAKNADELGGAYYETIMRFRWESVQKWREAWNATDDPVLKDRYEEKFETALKELEECSDVWGVIVRAYRKRENIFGELFGKTKSEIDRILTEKVQDLANNPLGRQFANDYEVASGLLAIPAGAYSQDRFTSNLGHTQMRQRMHDTSRAIENYSKTNWNKCWGQVKKVKNLCADDEGLATFGLFYDTLSKDIRALVSISKWDLADAVTAIMERTYASTEKGQQEQAHNYLYASISTLVNYGVWSDLCMGADFGVGEVSMDRFQKAPLLLARLLTDPEFSITVYDERGRGTLLTQRLLIGNGDPKAALLKWIGNNPQAAMCLRQQTVSRRVDDKGFSYANATATLASSIQDVAYLQDDAHMKALKVLSDKPGFAALLSLMTEYTGNKRSQVREMVHDNIDTLVEFLWSVDPDGDIEAFVNQMMESSGIPFTIAEIDTYYERGEAQAKKVAIGYATSDDVRDDKRYQYGQVKADLVLAIGKYARMAQQVEGRPPAELMTPQEAAAIFRIGDEEAVRSYFDIIQTISGVKTHLSVSINGAESRRNAMLVFLSRFIPEPCDAAPPVEMPMAAFLDHDAWRQFEQWNVFIPGAEGEEGRWIPIQYESLRIIRELSGDMVLIEDPNACTDPRCPCRRHATGDRSTNLGPDQTPALGRFLTAVRTLSTEGLNLKVKTVGNDGTDSVTKMSIEEFFRSRVKDQVRQVYVETEGDHAAKMSACRTVLTQHLLEAFKALKYEGVFTEADMRGVAHIMLKMDPIAGLPDILSVGRLNNVVKAAIRTAPAAMLNDSDALAEIAGNAIVDPTLFLPLDRQQALAHSVISGMKVQRQSGAFGTSLISKYESSISRNVELAQQILRENLGKVVTRSNEALDKISNQLMFNNPDIEMAWGSFVVEPEYKEHLPGQDRSTYRVIGALVDGKDEFQGVWAIGFKNAVYVDARHPKAALAIVKCYRLGLTVLLEGDLPSSQWMIVHQKTGGEIEYDQVISFSTRNGKSPSDPPSYMIPMFDIRLNGGNTLMRDDSSVGVFHNPQSNVNFIIESLTNEHGLADASFAPYRWYTRSVQLNLTGEKRIPLLSAFAVLVDDIKHGRKAEVRVNQKLMVYTDGGFTDEAAMRERLDGLGSVRSGRILEIIVPTGDPNGDTIRAWATEHGFPVNEMSAKYDSTARRATAAVGFIADGSLATDGVTRRIRNHKRASLVYLYKPDGSITESYAKGMGTKQIVEMAPKMAFPTIEEVKTWFLDPYVFETTPGAPIEFDRKMPIDIGRHMEEGSFEFIQFSEAVRRYIARQAEWDENGFIYTDIRPGDIVGWVKATYGDEVWFHPIRPYENENQAGAPDTFELVDMPKYDTATQTLIVEWVHDGTLEDRSFKIFEWLAASNKSVATSEALDDITFANGVRPAGQIAVQSTASRRLFMRRLQKMATLMFMARIKPYGYNLAELDGTFPDHSGLRDLIKTADAMAGDWDEVLRPMNDKGVRVDTDIVFNAAWDADLNAFCNRIARSALRAGVNPTVVFASDFGGVPADMWFNFNVLFEPGPTDQHNLMKLLHAMMPRLCPNGLDDEATNTLFNRDLQLLIPSTYTDANGEVRSGMQWVDVYGGFHFLDDHYSGRRYSGAKTRTQTPSTFHTLGFGGRNLEGSLLRRYLGWASMDEVLRENIPNRIELDTSEEQ